MTDIATRKTTLLERRKELLERSLEVEHELEAHSTKDWDDLAIEQEGDEVLEQVGKSAATEIVMIDGALARIETGEYGACVRCGEEISPERLDIVPHTPLCRKCARS